MTSLRFQGVTRAQSEIVLHWRNCAARSQSFCPSRQMIDPGVLRAHLANLSILEFDRERRMRFRIVGSRLRDIIDMDVRGLYLDDLPVRLSEVWALGLDAALERREPVGGVIAQPTSARQHAWLRLPLLDAEGRMRLVLCHDELVSEPDQGRRASVHTSIPGGKSCMAA